MHAHIVCYLWFMYSFDNDTHINKPCIVYTDIQIYLKCHIFEHFCCTSPFLSLIYMIILCFIAPLANARVYFYEKC